MCYKGVVPVAFSIRLTEEEKRLADSYAKLHSLSMGEAFKRALFERIEDEFDLTIAEEAYREYIKDGKKSKPITALWKECGL
jgi:predicted DNA-binding protein